MNQEERNLGSTASRRFRSTLNLVMGTIYLLLGGVVIYMKYFGTMELGTGMAYGLGGLMIVYGLFRLWRGFQDIKGGNS